MSALYAWGANSHGQLGLGYESEMCTTPQLVQSDLLEPKTIAKIEGGGGHLLILNKNGQVYACGWNHKGQLGIKSTENTFSIAALSKLNCTIVDIACGWDSSASIDYNGRLLVWGSNAFGQLGFSNRKSIYPTPEILTLPSNEKVKQVCFGLRYMCILCENNTVYVVGKWKYSQNSKCIVFNDAEYYQLQLVQEGFSIDHISSGSNHIVCASNSSNSVIAFGDNKFGQSRTSIEINGGIKCLCSGWSHNGVLTENGIVFLWGRNTYGQLARIETVRSEAAIQLSCLHEFKVSEFHLGSEHSMVVTNDGKILTWGWNEHGNCGNGNEENV